MITVQVPIAPDPSWISTLVGFHVYALRQVIGNCFDLYFHLWNSGVAYRESDKRRWELEQESEWTHVQSKKDRKRFPRQDKRWFRKPSKKVHFADDLVQKSPVRKHHPPSLPVRLAFGAFTCLANPDAAPVQRLVFGSSPIPFGEIPASRIFGRILSDLPTSTPCSSLPLKPALKQAHSSDGFQNLNGSVRCSRCLTDGH